MSDVRQMLLFPTPPQSPAEINQRTMFKDTVQLFLENLHREGKSEHTVKAFASDLELLAHHSGAETQIGHFTTTMLNAFLYWLEHGRGIPCSRKSYARRVTTLKVYFKWLHTLGALAHDPAKAILQRSGPAPLSEILTPVEVATALDFAQGMKKGDEVDFRPEFLFRILLETGIKKSEAMRLTPADFDRSNPRRPFMMIRHKVRNIYKERKIDLDADFLKVLDVYLDQYELHDTIFNCTSRNLEYILTDIGVGAGIATKLSFEMLRWTSAVRDYVQGMDEQLIREKLGLSEASWHETGTKIKKLATRWAHADVDA